jgi:glutaconate CoA-transferase, subunit B
MSKESPFTREELLIARAARELQDGDIVLVGVGLPNRAANLAQKNHARGAQLVYESGVYGAIPGRCPQSIGDPSLASNCLALHTMADLFLYYLQGGRIDIGFLGAAQIDRYGNLNTTVVGQYDHPKTRLPGGGGATEIALLSKRVVVVMRQGPRHFPPQIDFVTSPGHTPHRNGSARGNCGRGPVTVVTDMAVFGFHRESSEMELQSLHPGVTMSEFRESMGWQPLVSPKLSTTLPPSPEEVLLIRAQMESS